MLGLWSLISYLQPGLGVGPFIHRVQIESRSCTQANFTLGLGPDLSKAYMATSSNQSKTLAPNSEATLSQADRHLSWRVATNLLVSFRYAWQGISYAFRTQRNFRIHVVIGTVAISAALVLKLTPVEIAIICLTCGAVLTMELVNTALESVVDLTVQQSYHELAKIAKDCAAAAVLMSALISISVAVCLLLPPLWQVIQSA
jgi:diacylglycerol kinase (ATP)